MFIYAWAQEKVPWLLIPQLLPLTILSARWFGRVIESGAMRRPGPALATAAVGALTLWSLADANFLYDAPRPDQDPAISGFRGREAQGAGEGPQWDARAGAESNRC